MKLRQIYPKKKVQPIRQTLVPKAIQFEGHMYDGLSSVSYKNGMMGK